MKQVAKAIVPNSLLPFLRWARQHYIRVGRLVLPPAKPENKDGKVLLNLGCGRSTHASFINVDALADWHIHYCRPVENLRPFANNSVDLVYVSHCLEHFSHHKVNAVLAEWFRVLKPGGILRIGVPDFDQLIKIYELNGRDIESIQGVLMGGQTYPLNCHYVSFTKSSLTKRLMDVGFTSVREWQRGVDELTSLPDCTALTLPAGDEQIPISLNIEAIK